MVLSAIVPFLLVGFPLAAGANVDEPAVLLIPSHMQQGTLRTVHTFRHNGLALKGEMVVAGIGLSPSESPELLAVVYQVDNTQWFGPKERLFLTGTLVAPDDHERSESLAVPLGAPIEPGTPYAFLLGFDRAANEISFALIDLATDTPVIEGHHHVQLPDGEVYVGFAGTPSAGDPGISTATADMKLSRDYERMGLPVVIDDIDWQLTVGNHDTDDGAAFKPSPSHRFLGDEVPGLRIDWPNTPLPGHVSLEVRHSTRKVLARIPWSRHPNHIELGTMLEPGRSELYLTYVDDTIHHSLGHTPVEMLTGIESAVLEMPETLWPEDPVGRVRIRATHFVPHFDMQVLADGPGGERILGSVRAEALPPGESVIPFDMDPYAFDAPVDVTARASVWGIPQPRQYPLSLRGAWQSHGLRITAKDRRAARSTGFVGETPASIAFTMTHAHGSPVFAPVVAEWRRHGFQGDDGEARPDPVATFHVRPDANGTFEVKAPPDVPAGAYELRLIVPFRGTSVPFSIGRFFLGVPNETRKTVEITDGQLHIDGESTFLRGIGFYDFTLRRPDEWTRDLKRYADWGLNLVEVFVLPGGGADFGAFLERAEEAGIYVAADIHWRHIWDLEIAQRQSALVPYLLHWNHPNLVAWVLRDDVSYGSHYDDLVGMKAFIRQFDPVTPITTTMLDVRLHGDPPHPARGLSERQWADFADLLDFPMPYEYPVLRRGGLSDFGVMYNTGGGLDTIQTLAARTQDAFDDPNLYMWTWVQSHTQRVHINSLGLGFNESYTATPDQVRLLTYMAITAGFRGLLYYRDFFFEDLHFGIGRRHALNLIWHELGPLASTLAAGHRRVLLEPRAGGVEAVEFQQNDSSVVVLTRHRHDDVRYAGAGSNEDVIFTVPHPPPSARAYLLSSTGVRDLASELHDDGLKVTIPAFDLTALVLITAREDRVAEIQEAYMATLPDMARSALFILADTLAKVEAVSELLPAVDGTDSLLAEAAHAYANALQSYDSKEWRVVHENVTKGRLALRRLAQRQIEAADSVAGTGAQFRQSYFTLPQFYGHTNALAARVTERIGEHLAPLGGTDGNGYCAWHDC